jgi:hypothetical protein
MAITRPALGLVAALILGCCPPVKPTPNEVRALAASELPAGSSDADVIRFFEAHQFSWDDRPAPDADWAYRPGKKYLRDGARSMQGSRRAGGCESTRPIVVMLVTFDENRRVTAVDVRGASMLP